MVDILSQMFFFSYLVNELNFCLSSSYFLFIFLFVLIKVVIGELTPPLAFTLSQRKKEIETLKKK